MIRPFIALVLLGSLTWYLDQRQQRGEFQRVDEVFEDFLIANTRDRFDLEKVTPQGEVVYVGLNQADAQEYTSWPPPPLDWQMLIQALQAYEPEVLVICPPLNWGRPSPDFVDAVGKALLPFPSVVQAVEAQVGVDVETSFLGDLAARLPRYERVDGEMTEGMTVQALVTPPDPVLSVHGELGLRLPGDLGWPYAGHVKLGEPEGEVWIPTLLGQTLSRLEKAPYGDQRLRLGVGAGVHVGESLFVPLTEDGQLPEMAEVGAELRQIDALNLMTGGLVDALSDEEKAALKDARVVVLGLEQESGKDSDWASRLAQIVALPRVQRLPDRGQWLVWGVAIAVGMWMVSRVRRGRGLFVSAVAIFVALTLSYLLFQSELLWCPPALPSAVLLAAGVITLLFGRSGMAAGAASVEVEVGEKESVDQVGEVP